MFRKKTSKGQNFDFLKFTPIYLLNFNTFGGFTLVYPIFPSGPDYTRTIISTTRQT